MKTPKLLAFLSSYRLERRALKTIKKAQAEATRSARLTPDGLDPNDPDDKVFIQIGQRVEEERNKAKRLARLAQIKQIAYRLMEAEITKQGINVNQTLELKSLSMSAYKKAVRIYDMVEEAEKFTNAI
jgi:multidrug efflux pump subunit AcrA (membrane-fusion protein)